MHPSVPRPIRSVLVLATIASLLAIPFPTMAAPRGTEVLVTLSPLVAAVSPGNPAAFQALIVNDGNATVNAVTFTATVSAGTTSGGPSGCPGATTPLSCAIGSMAAGASVTLTFVLTAPAGGDVVFDGAVTFDAAQNNGNAASRDTIPADAVQIDVRGGDFVGLWVGPNTPLDESTPDFSNGQSTSVSTSARASGYPAMVEEIDGTVCGQSGFGDAVDLDIANGDPINLTVTLTYDKDTASGKSGGNVDVVHQTDDGDCPDLSPGCATNEVNCFDAEWQGQGKNRIFVIVVRLPNNGLVKGI